MLSRLPLRSRRCRVVFLQFEVSWPTSTFNEIEIFFCPTYTSRLRASLFHFRICSLFLVLLCRHFDTKNTQNSWLMWQHDGLWPFLQSQRNSKRFWVCSFSSGPPTGPPTVIEFSQVPVHIRCYVIIYTTR